MKAPLDARASGPLRYTPTLRVRQFDFRHVPHIVVAPDSFKGSLNARSICAAVARGLAADLAAREEAGRPIRVGIIGCGEMGTDLVTQIARMKGLRVAAIADHGSVPKLIRAAGGRIWSCHYADLDAAKVKEAHALGLQVLEAADGLAALRR